MRNSIGCFIGAIVFLCLCIGCQPELTKVVEKFDSGEIEGYYYIDKDSLKQGERIVYYKSGNIFSRTSYKDNNRNDSLYYYYDNEKNTIKAIKFFFKNHNIFFKHFYNNEILKEVGLLNTKNERLGKWSFYNKEGHIDYIKEFKIINGTSYTNQLWNLLSSGDTLNTGTSMRYEVGPRKLQLGDSIRFFFQSDVSYQPPGVSDFLVAIPKDYTKENFTKDFSNQDINGGTYSVPKQIRYSLQYMDDYPIEKKAIDTAAHYKTVLFYLKPTRIGKDTIRGYFDEVKSLEAGVPNIVQFLTEEEKAAMNIPEQFMTENRTIYFDIPIEVTN